MKTSDQELTLSILIPAYKEFENLKILIPELVKVLEGKHFEIIIVDSLDQDKLCMKLCDTFGVIYINRSPGNTYGDAIRTGIANIKGGRTIIMDADGSHSPSFILKMLSEMKENDLVIASRYIHGGSTSNNKVLVLMSKMLNKVYSLILKLDVYDVSNSFRCYKSNQLSTLHLTSNNFDIVEEILIKLFQSKEDFKILELPFDFNRRMFGKSKRSLIIFIYSYFKTLIRLKFRRK